MISIMHLSSGIAAVGTLTSLEDLSLRIKYIDMRRDSFRSLSALAQLKSLKLSGCVDVQAEGLCILAEGCLLLARWALLYPLPVKCFNSMETP